MSEPSPKNSLPLVPLAIAGAVALVGTLLIGVTLVAVLSPKAKPSAQASTAFPAVTARPVIIYTPTPLPTNTPTDTPTPTETPTLTLTPTKTFVPATHVPPTAVPTDPPTAIPVTPVPIGRGWLTNISLTVAKTDISAGAPDHGEIVFSFYFFNARGMGWKLGCAGVKVYDVAGNFVKTQWSLGNSALIEMPFNSGLNWSDSVRDMQPGSYTVSLWVRYDLALCNAAGGDWENLTPGGVQVNVH